MQESLIVIDLTVVSEMDEEIAPPKTEPANSSRGP